MNALDIDIAGNLSDVKARIGAAARRAGREPGEITLIAVSKTFSANHVRAAHEAGQQDFGENKVQEALQKIAETADIPLRWHLIGHLQSNKSRKVALPFACIHSIDSLELLRRIDDAAADSGGAPQVLVQVDLAGEETKFGAQIDEARRIVDAALACRAARLAGLMLLPPWNDDQEQTRPWFARLSALRDRWIAEGVPRDALRHLSMGMSHDFEAAIEEGATMVRVGTAIFGKRTKPATP
ncbi:MAG TPA: YggS family pyridoxal phosphate-dependent enzyme [Vicinamibacterales bacterium]|nr:YggS family pyridoxal phosphate-dependent enzyme [Vicinamibacterales bacterium]